MNEPSPSLLGWLALIVVVGFLFGFGQALGHDLWGWWVEAVAG